LPVEAEEEVVGLELLLLLFSQLPCLPLLALAVAVELLLLLLLRVVGVVVFLRR
jgi:hypothetical protein|tara:strand:- start:146 stop:307 length:162 start_codon:yes stop_codon:yes gene_type:complete